MNYPALIRKEKGANFTREGQGCKRYNKKRKERVEPDIADSRNIQRACKRGVLLWLDLPQNSITLVKKVDLQSFGAFAI